MGGRRSSRATRNWAPISACAPIARTSSTTAPSPAGCCCSRSAPISAAAGRAPEESQPERSGTGVAAEESRGSISRSRSGDTPGAVMFANRLRKNLKHLRRWAARENINCYRVYDADLPEYAVAVDLYGDWAHVQEYAPPSTVDPVRARRRLKEVLASSRRSSEYRPITWCSRYAGRSEERSSTRSCATRAGSWRCRKAVCASWSTSPTTSTPGSFSITGSPAGSSASWLPGGGSSTSSPTPARPRSTQPPEGRPRPPRSTCRPPTSTGPGATWSSTGSPVRGTASSAPTAWNG